MRIPDGYAHVAHFFEGTSVPNGAAVTYGIAVGGSWTPAVAAETLHGYFATHLMPNLVNAIAVRSTRVKFGPNATGPFGDYTDVVAGSVVGPQCPPNTAYLIEKHTQLGGRQGAGRFYLPGCAEADVADGGTVNGTRVDAIVADLEAWLNQMETNLHAMVLLHNSSLTPTPVTSLSVDPIVATRRRRLRR